MKDESKQVNKSLKATKHIQAEFDRKLFHLKTLYDVSQDILSNVNCETIVKNFLLMTMGNFGLVQGFIMILDLPSGNIIHFICKGFQNNHSDHLQKSAHKFLTEKKSRAANENKVNFIDPYSFSPEVPCALSFVVSSDCSGFLGLGPKLINEPYSEDDNELLVTLVNNLVIALKNAQSFEDIKRLNKDLQDKNVELERALNEIQAAMKKVEILERIKANLSQFVPNTINRLIEKSPTNSLPGSREQDISVLFIDIQGYSEMCEKFSGPELNTIVEGCFSVFMDAIYENNGDVNETAGDGLMILFLNEDMETNAMEAVKTAIMIQGKLASINKKVYNLPDPLIINMGISSGYAYVGITKFESLTGCRCTYTARGKVTNVAARIAAIASNGAILLSNSTADRVKKHFPLRALGKFQLKNILGEVEIFQPLM